MRSTVVIAREERPRETLFMLCHALHDAIFPSLLRHCIRAGVLRETLTHDREEVARNDLCD